MDAKSSEMNQAAKKKDIPANGDLLTSNAVLQLDVVLPGSDVLPGCRLNKN